MITPLFKFARMTRGLYRRVSDKFGVDPSYVSRIARGERRNAEIEAFLNREVQRIVVAVSKAGGKTKE